MVNKIRQTLLKKLLSAPSWLSGEDLSRHFSISRVAIWKHIKALREEGYLIESGHKGYRIRGERDNLSSLDFASSGEILFFRDLESTMIEAGKKREQQGEKDFIILAEHQSGGIGRNEQSWDSPDGGIYMTCMINHPLPLEQARQIPLYGILSVLQTLGESGIPSLGFRLPGDILIENSKVGGILEEYHVRGGKICWYALGIGIHINDSFKGNEQSRMASVADQTGIQLMRKDFIHNFRKNWVKTLLLKYETIVTELETYRLQS